jgi:hypothetical protein
MIAAPVLAATLSGLGSLLGPAAQSVPEAAGAGFSGLWERDPDRSDDAQAKMREAFEKMQAEMERRRGAFPGGGPPEGGAPGGRAQRRGPGEVPEELTIEHEEGELRVDDGERLQIFYLDGQKHRRDMGNGAKLETVATILGRVITIEEKLQRGRIDRKLELAEDGESLVLMLNIKLGNMKDPVLIKTVYERVE